MSRRIPDRALIAEKLRGHGIDLDDDWRRHLVLSRRTGAALGGLGLRSMRELLEVPESALLRGRYFGRKSLQELLRALAELGERGPIVARVPSTAIAVELRATLDRVLTCFTQRERTRLDAHLRKRATIAEIAAAEDVSRGAVWGPIAKRTERLGEHLGAGLRERLVGAIPGVEGARVLGRDEAGRMGLSLEELRVLMMVAGIRGVRVTQDVLVICGTPRVRGRAAKGGE